MLSPEEIIDEIKNVPLDKLQDVECVKSLIRSYGLVNDGHTDYGDENQFVSPNIIGIWQEPTQFAEFLVFCSKFKPTRICDIGTFTGGTAIFLTAYFERFCEEPDKFVVDSIDLYFHFMLLQDIGCLLPKLIYHPFKTSANFSHAKYDLVFVDGDHSYIEITADYKNIGRYAKLCAFHDINHAPIYNDEPKHGSVGFWRELKLTKKPENVREFLHHSDNLEFMGIGVIISEEDIRNSERRTLL